MSKSPLHQSVQEQLLQCMPSSALNLEAEQNSRNIHAPYNSISEGAVLCSTALLAVPSSRLSLDLSGLKISA
jgi:hypothetical protein